MSLGGTSVTPKAKSHVHYQKKKQLKIKIKDPLRTITSIVKQDREKLSLNVDSVVDTRKKALNNLETIKKCLRSSI